VRRFNIKTVTRSDVNAPVFDYDGADTGRKMDAKKQALMAFNTFQVFKTKYARATKIISTVSRCVVSIWTRPGWMTILVESLDEMVDNGCRQLGR
jgi:hypothetical protein